MSSILNLSCNTDDAKDVSKIIIREDHFQEIKNGIVEGKVSLKECSWTADNIINLTISLPKNSRAVFDPTSISSETTDGYILLVIKASNITLNEKSINNDKLFWVRNDDIANAQPLGQLNVLSGTPNNRISDEISFYNGTPNANLSLVSDGAYDATLEIIVAL